MPFLLGFFKIAICVLSLLLPSDGGKRRRAPASTFTPVTSALPELYSERYACVEFLPDDISYFRLNVTLKSPAILRDSDEAVLVQSSDNNTWHYLESMYDFYPEGELVVEFTLHFNNTPSGDCMFFFNDTSDDDMSATVDRTDSMTMEPYSKQTTPTPFVNATARGVTATPELVTGTKDNTVINNTTLVFLNVSTCLCPCKCTTVISKDNSDKMMAAMLEDLRIPKFETSLSKRKLSSAPDDRISSKGIGVVGTFVMTVVFGIILIGDVKLFLLNARTAYVNLRNLYAN